MVVRAVVLQDRTRLARKGRKWRTYDSRRRLGTLPSAVHELGRITFKAPCADRIASCRRTNEESNRRCGANNVS